MSWQQFVLENSLKNEKMSGVLSQIYLLSGDFKKSAEAEELENLLREEQEPQNIEEDEQGELEEQLTEDYDAEQPFDQEQYPIEDSEDQPSTSEELEDSEDVGSEEDDISEEAILDLVSQMNDEELEQLLQVEA